MRERKTHIEKLIGSMGSCPGRTSLRRRNGHQASRADFSATSG